MKIIAIIIGVICAFYFVFNIQDWKSFNNTKRVFKIISLLSLIVCSVYTVFENNDSYDYLVKNRAKLISSLFIDSIQNDSITYHLKIKNINPISAKNIKCTFRINDDYESENQGIESEISENESHLVYATFGNAVKIALKKGALMFELFIHYNSIWDEDTLTHNEKFKFFVPSNQIMIKEYEPISKLTDKVQDRKEIDSVSVADQIKKDEGTMFFVVYKKDLNKPINYIFNTDIATLYYHTQSSYLIFQKHFANKELLNIKKHLPSDQSKGYIIILSWSKNEYTLEVNDYPAVTVYRKTD